jgi:hypothetical protein
MKITIEFEGEDAREDVQTHLNVHRFLNLIYEWDMHIRSEWKHGQHSEEVSEYLDGLYTRWRAMYAETEGLE